MYDKQTHEPIKEFISIKEALRFLNKNNTSSTAISWVCQNKPKFKSAYGY